MKERLFWKSTPVFTKTKKMSFKVLQINGLNDLYISVSKIGQQVVWILFWGKKPVKIVTV